jgi:hypothetical protein
MDCGKQKPLRVSFELKDEAFSKDRTPGRDQCGEVAFGLAPAKPACTFKPDLLDCK